LGGQGWTGSNLQGLATNVMWSGVSFLGGTALGKLLPAGDAGAIADNFGGDGASLAGAPSIPNLLSSPGVQRLAQAAGSFAGSKAWAYTEDVYCG